MKIEPITQPIGFFLEGENIVVTNPCTIPIKLLKDVLKKKRKKNEVTGILMIQLPISFKKKKNEKKRKQVS